MEQGARSKEHGGDFERGRGGDWAAGLPAAIPWRGTDKPYHSLKSGALEVFLFSVITHSGKPGSQCRKIKIPAAYGGRE
jgi:hypothetical protein